MRPRRPEKPAKDLLPKMTTRADSKPISGCLQSLFQQPGRKNPLLSFFLRLSLRLFLFFFLFLFHSALLSLFSIADEPHSIDMQANGHPS